MLLLKSLKILLWEKYCNYPLTTTQGDNFARCENIVSRFQTSSFPPHPSLKPSYLHTLLVNGPARDMIFIMIDIPLKEILSKRSDSLSIETATYMVIGLKRIIATSALTIYFLISYFNFKFNGRLTLTSTPTCSPLIPGLLTY